MHYARTLFLTVGLGHILIVPLVAGESSPEPSPQSGTQSQIIPAWKHTGDNAQSVAISPNGKWIAAAFGGPSNGRFPLEPRGGGITIWDADNGKPLHKVGEYGDVVRLEFTHDSQALLYGRVYCPGDSIDFDDVVLLNVARGKQLQRWNRVYVSAASPTSPQILTAQGGGICNAFELNDLHIPGNDRKVEMTDSHPARCLAYTPEGSMFVAVHPVLEPFIGKDGVVKPNVHSVRLKGLAVFDAESMALQRKTSSNELQTCTEVDVSRNGKLIATGHAKGVVRVWDGSSLAMIQELSLKTADSVCPRFSLDGRQLAILSQPANAPRRLDPVGAGGIQPGPEQPGTTCELVFYETNKFQVQRRFVFEDGAFALYAGRRESLNPRRLAFSADGRHLLIGCNGLVLIETETGKIVRQFDSH